MEVSSFLKNDISRVFGYQYTLKNICASSKSKYIVFTRQATFLAAKIIDRNGKIIMGLKLGTPTNRQ
jgi:hypothetical protein